MGIIARIAGLPDDDNNRSSLGLPSRYRMPADIRRERDREVGRSIGRTQVIETDIRGIEFAGSVGIVAMANITDLTERAAARLPEERGRVDSIADTVAAAINRKVGELGGGFGQ